MRSVSLKMIRPIFTLSTSDKLHELVVRYSSWKTLQRTTAWLLKLKKCLMYYESCENRGNNLDVAITRNDWEEATVAIVKLVQRETHSEEIKDLEKHGNVKGSSKIARVRPMLVDGVIRVGGRISEAPFPREPRFQWSLYQNTMYTNCWSTISIGS